MKDFILNLGFVKEQVAISKEFKEELYRKAFTDARKDLEETNVYNVEERAKKLSRETISRLLGSFDEKLVITQDKKTGMIFIGGERIDESRIMYLKQEAEMIVNTDLWKIINNSINSLTRQVMFEKSESYDDLKNGKSILYTLSFQNNILKIFSTYAQKVSTTTKSVL